MEEVSRRGFMGMLGSLTLIPLVDMSVFKRDPLDPGAVPSGERWVTDEQIEDDLAWSRNGAPSHGWVPGASRMDGRTSCFIERWRKDESGNWSERPDVRGRLLFHVAGGASR